MKRLGKLFIYRDLNAEAVTKTVSVNAFRPPRLILFARLDFFLFCSLNPILNFEGHSKDIKRLCLLCRGLRRYGYTRREEK